LLYTLVVSFVLYKLIDLVLGLRVSADEETEGLDIVQHNEVGYDLR
jgi:Amt family ammonium transporter